MRIIDISMQMYEGMPIYPENPLLRIRPVKRVPENSSSISEIRMGSHTGTHIDTMLHISQGAGGIENIPLEDLVGPCQVVDLTHCDGEIKAEDLAAKKLKMNRVLLKTKNSVNRTDTFNRDFIHLSDEAARYLADLGHIRTVGVDYLSIQKFHKGNQETHRALLGMVTVIEGLVLDAARERRYELMCLPLKIHGLDGVPARAVLIERY